MKVVIIGSSLPLAIKLKKKISQNINIKNTRVVSIVNKQKTKKILQNEFILRQDFKKPLSNSFKYELSKTDIIYYLGWYRNNKYDKENFVNLSFIKNCKIYIKKNCKIIFLSSTSVFGNFNSCYAIEKRLVGQYIKREFINYSTIYSGLILNPKYGSYKKLLNYFNKINFSIYFGNNFYLLSTKETFLVNKLFQLINKDNKKEHYIFNRNEISLDSFIKKHDKSSKFKIRLNSKFFSFALKILFFTNNIFLKTKFIDNLQNFFGDNPWNIKKIN